MSDGLKDALAEFGPQVVEHMKASADKFVQENKDDVVKVGNNVINAIFQQAVFAHLQVPDVTEDDPLQVKVLAEKILEKRSMAAAIVMAAQRENNEAVVTLQRNILNFARTTAKFILALGVKAVLG